MTLLISVWSSFIRPCNLRRLVSDSISAYRHGLRPTVGLIGTIGAGKSTVGTILAGKGATMIDADQIGHDVLDDAHIKARIHRRFGDAVFREDGRMNRRALGSVVFANPQAKADLEAIVHPEIKRVALDRMKAAAADPNGTMAVVDAPLLLEAGWRDLVDAVLFVDAPRELRLARVARRNGWSDAELSAREAAQWPAERKRQSADAAIMNDGSIEDLTLQVNGALSALKLNI
jgi:dephospho-CoA kinase